MQGISSQRHSTLPVISDSLLKDLRLMIEQTCQSMASTVNAGLTLLYWHVGARIRKEIPKDQRAEYGKKIVATLWRQLTEDYGKGFLEKNLHRMIQFAEVFPNQQVILSLTRQLSWSHFRLLLLIKDAIILQFDLIHLKKLSIFFLNLEWLGDSQ